MLSAETRHKLDLFSAYGDAKRQIDILQGNLRLMPVQYLFLPTLWHMCNMSIFCSSSFLNTIVFENKASRVLNLCSKRCFSVRFCIGACR